MSRTKSIFFALFFVLFSVSVRGQILTPVKWGFSMEQKGEKQKLLVLTATIENGWHLYGVNIPEGGPLPTSIAFEQIKGAKLVGEYKVVSPTIRKMDANFGMELSFFDKKARFEQLIELTGGAFEVSGYVKFMACNDQSCLPPTTEPFSFSGTASFSKDNIVQEESTSGTIVFEPIQKQDSVSDVDKLFSVNDLWRPVIDQIQIIRGDDGQQQTPWFIFLAGFLGGLLALLTPCVWPMIPMTVSFFLKRSKDRSKAISEALIFGLSIILIYVGLGLLITLIFGASALNALATNAIVNIFFALLLIVFGASFLGAFEIQLPSSWSNAIDRKADKTTGLMSIFLIALTLALVSFSCTGPIIGTLLVEAASSGAIFGPMMGMFGFALALSIPFALFAMFPSWLKRMPQSGGWLNSVKVVLGFLELAFALKFLSVADMAYGWGLLDREVFLVLWIVLFALLGFYLLGFIRFAHDDQESKRVSVFSLFLSIVSLSFALYMVPGLWGAPLKGISAFAPPMTTQDFNLYQSQEVHAPFDDYDLGMKWAAEHKKPVLIDFSGYGCVNCRKMEASVWSDPLVKEIIQNQYVLITLMVDDKRPLTEPMMIMENGKSVMLKTIGEKWSYLQRYKFGANAQPYYLILNNQGDPLAAPYGFNENPQDFARFLEQGLRIYK